MKVNIGDIVTLQAKVVAKSQKGNPIVSISGNRFLVTPKEVKVVCIKDKETGEIRKLKEGETFDPDYVIE